MPTDDQPPRVFPPLGWGWEVAAGWNPGDRPPMVRAGDVMIPKQFRVKITPSESGVVIMLRYEVTDGAVRNASITSYGMESSDVPGFLTRYGPMNYWVTMAIGRLGFAAALDLLRRAHCGECIVKIAARGDGEASAFLDLRDPSLDQLVFSLSGLRAIARRGQDWGETRERWRHLLDEEGPNQANQAAASVPLGPSRRKDKVTDALLRQVADVYRQASRQTGKTPTRAVAEHFGKSHSTAARWVGLARKAGILRPTTRGKSGEQDEAG